MLEARPTSCTRSLHVARPARQLLARRRFPHAVKTGFGCPMAPTKSFSHEIPFHYQTIGQLRSHCHKRCSNFIHPTGLQ
jgi:hypothetical protein